MKLKASAILMILILILCFCMSGCSCENDERLHTEDFYYRILSTTGKYDYVYITGLTEKAKNAEFLIIPDEIDGMPVESVGTFTSMTLKKLYVSKSVRRIIKGRILFARSSDCKVLYISNTFKCIEENCTYYVSEHAEKNYREKSGGAKLMKVANVSYWYNYPDAPNEGIYFIDDLNEGEGFEFVPPDPTRDNFTFAGWYSDEECTEPFDMDGFSMSADQRINLYAGWK